MPRGDNKLTALKVARLTRPGRYSDGANLYLQVSKSKGKSWLFRVERQAITRWMGLGPVRTVSLEQARALAKEARWCVLNGIDPVEKRRERVQLTRLEQLNSPDFETCAKAYIEKHEPSWTNTKHRQQWPNTLATYVYPIIGAVKVKHIDTAMVLQVLEPIWNSKATTASRLRGRLERILAWAKVQGYREGDNPACWRGHLQELLPRPRVLKEAEHLAALPHTEVATLWHAVDVRAKRSAAAQALKFTILSASRTNEVLGAQWNEFDWTNRVWTIPPQRMKRKRPHRVPLVPAMQVILAQQWGLHDTWVFINRRSRCRLSDSSMLKLLRRMKCEDITVHGFRSCFRDWAAEKTRHSDKVADMALSHKVGNKTKRAYLRTELFERRRKILDDWAAYCLPFPGEHSLHVMLACELTDMSVQAKLISLALVAASSQTLYVEVPGNYEPSECDAFAREHVLPQLNPGQWGVDWAQAQQQVVQFLASFAQPVIICTTAPEADWRFFCQIATVERHWPANVIARPQVVHRPKAAAGEARHHALADARTLLERWRQQHSVDAANTVSHPASSDATNSEMP